jgi:hypothetical protein
MKRNALFAVALSACCLFVVQPVKAQADDPPKYEVGAEFISLAREKFSGGRADPGLGGRFTFNFNRNVAVEAAGYFFPQRCFSCERNGRMSEAVFGVKAGKRFQKWGIFAKARPGLVSFSQGSFNVVPLSGGGAFPFRVDIERSTHFAADLGGVLEFYPMRHIVTRFDAGNTIIHYGARNSNFLVFDPTTGGPILVPLPIPARTTHNFQFSAGVGFRF